MRVTLSDLADPEGLFVDGDWVESKDQDPGGDVRLVQLADVGDGEFLDKSSRYLTSTKAKQLKCTYLQEGDLLIARMPDPIGRACVFPEQQQPSVTVVDVCIVRPNRNRVCPRWLLHKVNSHSYRREIGNWLTGSTRQRISRGNLSKIEFELPPLNEQRRIAAILDKADALRRKRKRALDLLDSLTQSIFLEMFGDPIENPRKLPRVPLERLVAADRKITYGILKPGPDIMGGVPYVRVLDMLGGKITFSSLKRTTTAIASEYRRSALRAGDLLMSIRGHVGRTAIVPADCDGANITQDTARIAISRASTDFVRAQIEMPSSVQWMARRTKGAAVKGINLADVRVFPVLLASDEQQTEFARAVSTVNALTKDATGQSLKANELFSSFQARAFTGQL